MLGRGSRHQQPAMVGGGVMDALWLSIGAAAGATLTAIGVRALWLTDRYRLEGQITAREDDIAYVKRVHEADWRRMNAEIDQLKRERAAALIDLHTVKSDRLTAWKEASQ